MKRVASVLSVVVLVLAVSAWAQTPARPKSGSAEQELIRLEKEWGDAEVKRDAAFFDWIMADDFIGTGSAGNVYNKAQDIANLKSGEDAITSAVLDEMEVRVYGDAAVVTYHSTEKGQFKGKDYSVEYRWTDTWINKAGRWQCLAVHTSKIAQR